MKRILAALMAVCMLCPAAALAEHEITGNAPEVDTYVSVHVEENTSYDNGFIVYIPENVDFTNGCMNTETEIGMEVYNTDSWSDGTKLQVLLRCSENFAFGYDEEYETWWGEHFLRYEGRQEDGDDRSYDIPYAIFTEDGSRLVPWEFDTDGNDVSFNDEYSCGEIMKYIWCFGDHGEREQTATLTLKLEPGDRVLKGGDYSDRLTFTVISGECDAGELLYEGNGIKVPMPVINSDGYEIFFDNAGNEYYRLWGEEYGDFGTYYLMGTDTPVDVSGITEMHVRFTDWADALEGDGDPRVQDNEDCANYGITYYNSFKNDEYMIVPASAFSTLCPDGDMTGDWLNDLSFDPNTDHWVW